MTRLPTIVTVGAGLALLLCGPILEFPDPELNDRVLLELTGWISGHTIKHLLATAAAATVVWGMSRSRETAAGSRRRPSQLASAKLHQA